MAEKEVREGGRGSFSVSDWAILAPQIWQYVNRGESYQWRLSRPAQDKFRRLLPDAADCLRCDDPEELGTSIRAAVRNAIRREPSPEGAAAWFDWIVSDWGGIRNGRATVASWAPALTPYSSARAACFIQRHSMARVSSWSKILSYLDPSEHAIYDSRTAVALNCALAMLHIDERFIMPQSRNVVVSQVAKLISGKPVLSYYDYLSLLSTLVRASDVRNMTAGEMILFANAPKIAAQFRQERLL